MKIESVSGCRLSGPSLFEMLRFKFGSSMIGIGSGSSFWMVSCPFYVRKMVRRGDIQGTKRYEKVPLGAKFYSWSPVCQYFVTIGGVEACISGRGGKSDG